MTDSHKTVFTFKPGDRVVSVDPSCVSTIVEMKPNAINSRGDRINVPLEDGELYMAHPDLHVMQRIRSDFLTLVSRPVYPEPGQVVVALDDGWVERALRSAELIFPDSMVDCDFHDVVTAIMAYAEQHSA